MNDINDVHFVKNYFSNEKGLGWLVHLVNRFAFNTKVVVDASSNPPVFSVKLWQKPRIKWSSRQTNKQANIASSISQMVIQ